MAAPELSSRTFDFGEDRIRFQGLAMSRAEGWMTEADPQQGFMLAACGSGEQVAQLPRLVRTLRGVILGAPPPDGTQPTDATRQPLAARRPPAIERLVLCLRQTHALLARSTEREASTGLSVLIALYDRDRLHIVHAGGRLRLIRLNVGGACEPLAGPLPDASPALVGGADVVRIEVGSEPTRTGDLFVALPVAVEPDAAEETLIAGLAHWQAEIAGRPETAELTFPLAALPQAFACLAVESAAAGETTPAAGEVSTPADRAPPDAWSDLLATAREAVQEIAESRAEKEPPPVSLMPVEASLSGRTVPQPAIDPPAAADVAYPAPRLEIVKLPPAGELPTPPARGAIDPPHRPRVHPWIERRQRRAVCLPGQTWLVLIGILSAIAGALGVLLATGALERLFPAAGSWLP